MLLFFKCVAHTSYPYIFKNCMHTKCLCSCTYFPGRENGNILSQINCFFVFFKCQRRPSISHKYACIQIAGTQRFLRKCLRLFWNQNMLHPRSLGARVMITVCQARRKAGGAARLWSPVQRGQLLACTWRLFTTGSSCPLPETNL